MAAAKVLPRQDVPTRKEIARTDRALKDRAGSESPGLPLRGGARLGVPSRMPQDAMEEHAE